MTREQIRNISKQRIGRDSRQSVAAAALQAHDQLVCRHCRPLGLLCIPGQFIQQLQACLYFVLNLLRDQEFNTVRINVPQHFLENAQVVILTAKAQHQHTARIGMVHHGGQKLLRIFEVVSQLRAAIRMDKAMNAVNTIPVQFVSQALKRFCRPVHAADRIDNPDLIPDSDPSVLTHITLKGCFPVPGQAAGMRMIRVLQQPGKIRLHIVRMYPAACRNI